MLLEKEVKDALGFIGSKALKGSLYGPPEYLSERKKCFRRMTLAEMEHYYEKVTESQGFDVDGCDGVLEGRILPLNPKAREWENAIKAAHFAAETYYPDKRLESISLSKANRQPVYGFKYYLTFTAKNTKNQGKIQTFRAKVWTKPPLGDERELQFFEEVKPAEKPSTSRKRHDPIRSKDSKGKKKKVGRKKRNTDDPSLTLAEATAVASEEWKSLSIDAQALEHAIVFTYHRRTKKVDGEYMDKAECNEEDDKRAQGKTSRYKGKSIAQPAKAINGRETGAINDQESTKGVVDQKSDKEVDNEVGEERD